MSPGYALDHIALGLHRIADGVPFLTGELGGRFKDGGPSGNFTGAQWTFADGERLELIEPLGEPGGFMHRFLEARGPGVHHVTFKVPDIAAAAERVQRFGYEVVGYNDDSPYWKEVFLHPKQALGIVVQRGGASAAGRDGAVGRGMGAGAWAATRGATRAGRRAPAHCARRGGGPEAVGRAARWAGAGGGRPPLLPMARFAARAERPSACVGGRRSRGHRGSLPPAPEARGE